MMNMLSGLLESYVKPEHLAAAKVIIEEVLEDGKLNQDDIPKITAKLVPLLKDGGADAIKDILKKFAK